MGGPARRPDPTLEDLGPELTAQVALLLGDGGSHDAAAACIELVRLRHRSVFRARVAGNGTPRSVVIKRLGIRAAQRNRLVAERWLPWLGLEGVAPAILGTAAGPGEESVWQIYEDVNGATLRAHLADRECVAAAVDEIAEIHTRAAGHPVVSECRREGDDFGSHYFTSNVRDALNLLEALRPPVVRPNAEQAALRDRLRQRLERLLDTPPDRSAVIAEAGGPDTLLHGDLWPANVLILRGGGRVRVRIIDWDHAGAGPISYDLSCFLSRFAPPDRPGIVERYRSASARAGWQLPSLPELNLLFESAECARYANRMIWPALALLHGDGPWGFVELAEIEQWFAALKPMLEA